mmetsp:Transcript_13984/g.22166  ORF Transcript_13984/g.22166 Transcript_13984/m.22166 type:complete len:366 (+) Transcript_13984:57-1154(+)
MSSSSINSSGTDSSSQEEAVSVSTASSRSRDSRTKLSIDTDVSSVSLPEDVFMTQSKIAIPAKVIVISGCRDDQQSADVKIGDVVGGAFTTAFLDYLEKHDLEGGPTWAETLIGIRDCIKTKGYAQVPVLTCGQKLDLSRNEFSLCSKHMGADSATKALLIGINYSKSAAPLQGCHQDVRNMSAWLLSQNFGVSNTRTLLDSDEAGVWGNPTHENIKLGLQWLAKDAKKGDSLFFHFSGHGTSVRDDNDDEIDALDEAIVPVDFRTSGVIVDDLILEHLVLQLPEGVKLTCLFDCCHSGSIVDLPYKLIGNSTFRDEEQMVQNRDFNFGSLVKLGMNTPVSPKNSGLENLHNFGMDMKGVLPVLV